jgi:preprotein translocase subunit SecE
MAMVVVMAILMWFLDAVLLWAVRFFTGPGG